MKIIYITAKNEKEAMNISMTLVKEKLIACANIHNIKAIYEWKKEGKDKAEIQEDNEAVIIAKTTDALVDEAMARTKELHSYECPSIIVIPVEKGNKDYLKWVEDVTTSV
ncbi:MAG: divalent-cation tolerance protein CutA [Candidatus Woesearchaeota archaeon]